MATATLNKPHQFLTIIEVADELKLAERSVRSLVAAGKIRAVKFGPRMIRVPRAELERLAAAALKEEESHV